MWPPTSMPGQYQRPGKAGPAVRQAGSVLQEFEKSLLMSEENKPERRTPSRSTPRKSTAQFPARSTPPGRRERRAYGEGVHPDPGRPGGRAQASGHVHRRHLRRHRPAPPGVRGGRQLHRRSAGRPLRRHRRHHPHRQLDQRDRQRPRHSHRHQDGRQARAQALGGRNRADRTARRRQVQPEQLQGLGRPARRGRELRQRAVARCCA